MTARDFFVHPTALVGTDRIGSGTRIWAFANVQQGATIGDECNICDHCFVEKHVRIGNRVTVKNGVSLWEGLTIEDDVFIGPGAVFTNDIYPRSKIRPVRFVPTVIRKGATIGANAVVIAGNIIGAYALIGAGSIVTRSIPDYNLWQGNPARFASFVCRCAAKLDFSAPTETVEKVEATCAKCGLSYHLDSGKVTRHE